MKNKNVNLDFIRSVAVFFVLSVHFFMHSGFYEEIITGSELYLETTIRTTFATCVPLFLLLSGYLMNQKTISKKYYVGLFKVIIPYCFSILCIGVYQVIVGEAYTIASLVLDIISFEYYSWYIEMYLGLYLVIPFLNIIYNNLESKEHKKLLLLVCILATIAPTFFNAFDKVIFPDWWQTCFPVVYYFMGAFIAEYKDEIQMNMRVNFLLIAVSILLTGGFCYWRSYGDVFNWGSWCTAGGFANLFNAPLVFIFLLRLSLEKLPGWIAWVIGTIARVSLPIYLTSYVWDSWWYPILKSHVTWEHRMYYYLPSIVVTFGGSFILAVVVEKISTGIYSKLSKVI